MHSSDLLITVTILQISTMPRTGGRCRGMSRKQDDKVRESSGKSTKATHFCPAAGELDESAWDIRVAVLVARLYGTLRRRVRHLRWLNRVGHSCPYASSS